MARSMPTFAALAVCLFAAGEAAAQSKGKATTKPPPGLTLPPAPLPPPPLPPLETAPKAFEVAPPNLPLPSLDASDVFGAAKLCIFRFVQRDLTAKDSGLLRPSFAPATAVGNAEDIFNTIAKDSPALKGGSQVLVARQDQCDIGRLEGDGTGDAAACLARLGSLAACENVMVGILDKRDNGFSTSLRLVNVAKKAMTARTDAVLEQKSGYQVGSREIAAWLESQACRAFKVDCKGTIRFNYDRDDLVPSVDGKPAPRNDKRELTVAPGTFLVSYSKGPIISRTKQITLRRGERETVYGRQTATGAITELTSSELIGSGAPPASVEVKTGTRWNKPVGLAVAGAGLLAAGFATYEGLHGKSLYNQASDQYRAHGLYMQSDLQTLTSAKNASTLGNVFLVAGAAAIAAGLILTFAF
jgi:hypothetical protein